MDLNVVKFDPTKKAFSLLDEFKKFAFKGNMIEMAIGIVIGAAFTGLVNSLVKNVIMPLVSIVLPGEHGYAGWTANVLGVDVPYGLFLGELVNFLIVAFAVFFFMVKLLGFLLRKDDPSPAPPPPPTKSEELLTEIRDLLKRQA